MIFIYEVGLQPPDAHSHICIFNGEHMCAHMSLHTYMHHTHIEF